MQATPRPTYETPYDMDAEDKVALILAEKWKCEVQKLPQFYRVDRALTRDSRIEGLVEIKCRLRVRRDKYPTYMLSVSKLGAMDALARAMKIPVFLVVEWEDEIGYIETDGLLAEIEDFYIGGRVDRNDKQDKEPVVYIPIEDFTCLLKKQSQPISS